MSTAVESDVKHAVLGHHCYVEDFVRAQSTPGVVFTERS